MGAGASLQVERIPKEAFTRVVVSYIAKNAADVSNDEFLQMIVEARLDGYIQGDDLVLVRAELDACLKEHAGIECSLGTMEIVQKTVTQLRQRFSGPDTPTSAVHRVRDRGDSKCGDEFGAAAEKEDALMKLVGRQEDARPRLTALLVNYIGKKSSSVDDDEFISILRAANLHVDELSKAEVELVRRELDAALGSLSEEETSVGVYGMVEKAVTRVLSSRK
mmetsp:Transcript_27911/g.64981  ORF Transcript_27911/g.64981 Transcript_27911/m.64981 type:complete len:221 (-) Transcript_27911:227-889(-)